MKNFKLPLIVLLCAGLLTLAFYGCKKDAQSPTLTSAAGRKTSLDKVTLSCGTATGASISITVCAGPSGAPAGFSVQWMTKAAFEAAGGVWPDYDATTPNFCKASFSGVPGCSNYNLAANACISVEIGDNLFDDCGASSTCTNTSLDCGTDYVFRAFAHNDPASGLGKSAYSANQTCSTLPCGGEGCTYTQGFWKTHGPEGCVTGNNTDMWPVSSLTLGTVSYTDLQLCSILNTPAGGNGLLSLAHQLIAAELNIANGSDGSAITQAIADANTLIGGLVIPPVGSGFLAPSATSSLITTLANFNEGLTGPGHCSN
jgi:hypothetical protein